MKPIDPASAIDAAKSFFGPIEGEPRVPATAVLLREVIHALEIMWGYSDQELQYGHDPRGAYAVLHALKNADLVARVYDPGHPVAEFPVIPTPSWPHPPDEAPRSFMEPDDADAVSPVSSYWISTIEYDQDCRGYVGHLPVVPREEAEAWLKRAGASRNYPAIPRRLTHADTEAVFLEYVAEFNNATPPTQAERKVWRQRHGIGRDRLSELVKDLAPEEWSRPGRRKTKI
ncbi:hypothetical protein SAMN05444340_1175 [Citreimonas salinaria]|uniref:Uncharacterized protein n=1 Tax=Citreimonas salinaria TaxID=321339 RepID=A0A1H3MG96_9RHOB|nr:hypothetical protein SAMN05444340_1175 [Citreimonas salinaria]